MNMTPKICLRMLAVLVVSLGFAAAAAAGDLEPPGPPEPTMKTLDEVPPTWSQKITDASKRFKIVLDGQGVLDKETGLVWEKSYNGSASWEQATWFCYNKGDSVGRAGWRLPRVEELMSLTDPTTSSHLPSGHPFVSFWDGKYWTSTNNGTAGVWVVDFATGDATVSLATGIFLFYKCVRGGHGQ
jgi:hypothetical protein